MEVSEAWKQLSAAAQAYALLPHQSTGHALAEAACEYAKARWVSKTGPAARRPDDGSKDGRPVVRVPFGRSKGRTLSECDDGDLRWLLGVVTESVDNPTKERWRAANVELREAIEAELLTRGES